MLASSDTSAADATVHGSDALSGFVGVSPEAAAVRRLIDTAARCDLPALLCGETGVGKEIVARAIHAQSYRSQAPLVAVNMATLPETLADAELFGAAKGAYTGAKTRQGYFQAAHGGTLFLDELGETPMAVQPKLLRVLQEGEVPVVGGRTQRVDARIIAASDANLTDVFVLKQPLLHRLAGIRIDIPALSARREDMGLLLCAQSSKGDSTMPSVPLGLELAVSTPAIAAVWAQFVYDALTADWPGNVRALLVV